MLLGEILKAATPYWPLILVGAVAIWLLNNKYGSGLNKYPGPALAQYTNLWRFFDALARTPERTHIRLHREHGDIVRLGPNVLSFADPKAVKTIYGLNKGFVKVGRTSCGRTPMCQSRTIKTNEACSPTFIRSKMPFPRVIGFNPSFPRRTRITMHDIAAA